MKIVKKKKKHLINSILEFLISEYKIILKNGGGGKGIMPPTSISFNKVFC